MTNFETQLRQLIADAPPSSSARNLFKVVLGEWQTKTTFDKGTDEVGYNIIRKMIKANEENLGYLAEGDSRRAQYQEENELLSALMPSFLSAEQIQAELAGVDLTAAKSDGQAMGLAMKHLKSKGLSVEGDTVKQVVAGMRE